MSELRLGILGLSEGNGHPYSWSAIFNGYDPMVMAECPFQVIPTYLARQSFPHDSISGARVTHIWTQTRSLSEHIARASRIDNVVNNYHDMIGQVDAILLARDDAENHLVMSRPFLEVGLPIFIDKPIALNRRDLDAILSLEQYSGQVFSCSAMRYAKELHVTVEDRAELGNINYGFATTPKQWHTYAVHIIEPMLLALGDQGDIEQVIPVHSEDRTAVTVRWSSGVISTFGVLGKTSTPIQIQLYGDKHSKIYTFSDTFSAFRASLIAFIESVQQRKPLIPRTHMEMIVEIIERGTP